MGKIIIQWIIAYILDRGIESWRTSKQKLLISVYWGDGRIAVTLYAK